MSGQLESWIEESIATKQRLLANCIGEIEALCDAAMRTIEAGGKLMLCGNGGSSCDAAHAAGELVGWFEDKERDGIAAIALGHEVPALTAIGNDASFEQIFARQVRALGKPEDLLIGISTSGGSKNVVAALEVGKTMGIATAGLISERGGRIAELADVSVRVPSQQTARIQESHLLVIHLLCATIEQRRAAR